MGLHDRIKGNGSGNGHAAVEEHPALAAVPQTREPAEEASVDPYGELKTRVHHACIVTLGPHLFSNQSTRT